jgi:hypothetical protein
MVRRSKALNFDDMLLGIVAIQGAIEQNLFNGLF